MIALALALALQTDATPRPAPTPPFIVSPAGFAREKVAASRRNPAIRVWSRFTSVGGEESVIVSERPSGGLTAQGFAQIGDGASGADYRIVASRSHPLCGGSVRGWEIISTAGSGTYGKTTIDELVAVDATTAYRVEYERVGISTPSAGAMASLRSFCPTLANVTTADVTRGAIATPPSWRAFDISTEYRQSRGAAIQYMPSAGSNRWGRLVLFRQPSPGGVDPDVDADIKYDLDYMTRKAAYTILSKRGVALCDSGNDGWEVVARIPFQRGSYHNATVLTVVFAFGSPYSYSAIYSRAETEKSSPVALQAVESLCPGREATK